MKWPLTLVSLVLVATVAAGQPDFDPKDVVRQSRRAHSTPRSLDPSIPALDDGEFLIDTSIARVPAAENQGVPGVAFDGTNFLVVWMDCRSGSSSDIYGARVTPEGAVLDPEGLSISTGASFEDYPAVAFDGANFLVVWQDGDIHGARVTPEGTVLDPQSLPISTAAYGERYPAVAFDGASFLVVWEDYRSGGYSDIYGARVTPQGAVLDPQGLPISTVAYGQRWPAVAFDGANFLVVWHDYGVGSNRDIYGARVTPAGTVLDPQGLSIGAAANNQFSPAVSFDGSSFLVVWEDSRSGSNYDIYGARVTPAGTVLDPLGLPISTEADNQWSPAVSFDGASFLVVWKDERSGGSADIYGARVTPGGTVLDPQGLPISTAANHRGYPAVAFGGAGFLVVWEDWRSGNYDIYGARVTPQGAVLDPQGLPLSTVANHQRCPAVAFDGTVRASNPQFLVVWDDCRNYSDIYGARVTPEGTVLDPQGLAISTAAYHQWHPAVASDGALGDSSSRFLVVWMDGRSGSDYDIYGSRLAADGAVLDPQGIPISTAAEDQWSPAVAFDGALGDSNSHFLVVWMDERSGSDYDIYGARVTPEGAVLDSQGFPISTAAHDQWSPAVAFDGADFLVVWEDLRNGDYDVYGARVTPEGTVLDPQGIPVSAVVNHQRYPVVAFDGALGDSSSNFLVVWMDYRSGSYSDIYGARVTPQGTVLDPQGLSISAAAEDQWSPAVTFDGTDFLVVWEDERSGGFDIHGARVSKAGVVFDSGPRVRQEGDQWYPALARGSGADMLLVYQGWTGTVGNKTYNTDRIWGKMNPLTAVAEGPESEGQRTNAATIVRGVLNIGPRLTANGSQPDVGLYDASGRKVMELEPGENDIRHLAPGMYFLRSADSGERSAVQKVVILR